MKKYVDSILLIAGVLVVTWLGRSYFLKRDRGLAGGQTSWKVTLTSDVTCDLGELDALDMDLFYAGRTTPLALTVESEAGVTLGSKSLKRDDFSQPVVLELPAPTDSTAPVHVYLCTDRTKVGACRGKSHPRITEIIVDNTRAAAKNAGFNNPPDRIFYSKQVGSGQQPTIRAVLLRHGGACR